MKAKTLIPIREAIEEAIRFGFRDRFVLKDDLVHSLKHKRSFFETEYAVVESYPVILSNGHKGRIQYIVLNNGQLGFLVKEGKGMASGSTTETQPDNDAIDGLLENIYNS